MPFKNDKQRKATFARLNANRTQQAMNSDLGKRAANTLPYSADNVKAWRSDPGRIDIEGIDTPMLKIDKIHTTEYIPQTMSDDIEYAKTLGYEVKLINRKPTKFYGKHFPDKKTIEIYKKGRTEKEIHDSLNHEIGHILDYKRRGIVADPMGDSIIGHDEKLRPMQDTDIYFRYGALKNEAENIRKEIPRGDSAATTQKEIYADAYKLYKNNPERLKEIAPGIFEQINKSTPNKQSTEDFKVNKTLINEDLARHAHSGTSFDPELRAKSEVDTFEFEMKNTYKTLSEGAKTPEQKAILNEEMQRYQENYAKKWNELLSSKSRIISPMITGPANFPVRRNQKANDAYHNKYGKFMEWNSKARGSISSKIERHEKQKQIEAAGGEVALMKQKLKKAEDHQEYMKATNKIIRKKITEKERVEQLEKIGVKAGMSKLLIETGGYETYQLTNNNANIKRMKDRVVDMEKKESTPTSTTKFSGGEIIDNNQADRVQIFFDEKPDAEMRGKLKGSGWRWSPSNGVWQRKRTNAALHSAQQITGE